MYMVSMMTCDRVTPLTACSECGDPFPDLFQELDL